MLNMSWYSSSLLKGFIMIEITDYAKEKYKNLQKEGDVHIVPTVRIRCFVPCVW